MIIGIDFDNTIIDYNNVFLDTSKSMGFLPQDISVANFGKEEIRNFIRSLDKGETKWQKLQAQVYGPQINKASIMDGFLQFLYSRQKYDDEIYIISHKSLHPAQDENINLRQYALEWLESQNLFHTYLSRINIFFESTRREKLARIQQLKCHVFIDDLVEIFMDPRFPSLTYKILLTKNSLNCFSPSIIQFDCWDKITQHILDL